jgi:hypothetical protein
MMKIESFPGSHAVFFSIGVGERKYLSPLLMSKVKPE